MLVGFLTLVCAPVQLAEAEVAVSDERTHAELARPGQRLTVVVVRLIGVGQFPAGGDIREEAECQRLGGALAVIAGELQGAAGGGQPVLRPREESAHSSRPTGSVNVNVDPCPTRLLTQMRPPCNSTNLRESARPSPVPSTFLSAVPTWRNSSKTAS